MSSAAGSTRFYEFGPFRIDVSNRLLLRGTSVVPLKPKVVDTLIVLVENRGRVIRKEELMRALWPDSFVEEANLTQNIYTLRNVLAGTAGRHRYIETIQRRGYRFVADVKEVCYDPAADVSLAVLPFKPIPASVRDESLEVGIADALVTALGNSCLLTVRPISASRKYTEVDQDPLIAARELAVSAVLDGSIQRSGNTIRVTARLIDANDGSTLWTDRFDEAVTSIFAVQDSIAEQIASALNLKIGSNERALLIKRYTDNTTAYRLYLSGRYNWNKSTEQGLWKAIEFFNQAIAVDSGYALAYAGLADAYTALDWYGVLSTRQSNPKAFAAAERAVEIDGALAEAHVSLAVARQYRWDWKGSELAFRRAIALNPNLAPAHQWYGNHLTFRGGFDNGFAEMRRAQALDPVSLMIASQIAMILYCARRYDEAIEQCLNTLDIEPACDEARVFLGLSYLEKAMPQDAIAEFQRTALAGTPDVKAMQARALALVGCEDDARGVLVELTDSAVSRYIPHFWLAGVHVSLGENFEALTRLEMAYEDPDDSFAAVKVVPFLDPVRAEPRYRHLLARMGLD